MFATETLSFEVEVEPFRVQRAINSFVGPFSERVGATRVRRSREVDFVSIIIVQGEFWLLVFADDYLLRAAGHQFVERCLGFLVVTLVFGFDLKWEKGCGGAKAW